MEKHDSRSLAKKTQPARNHVGNNSSLNIGKRTDSSRKPSREDISLCINIWAYMYHLDRGVTDLKKLHIPSQPWVRKEQVDQKHYDRR